MGKNVSERKSLYKKKDKPLVVSDAMAMEFASKKRVNNIYKFVKMEERDKLYLSGMLEILIAQIEPLVPDGEVPYKTKEFRHTPRQLWENIKKYFQITIEMGQPLTISGIVALCGLSKKYFFNEPKISVPKEYAFLEECKKFVEMYNEFAAHKKMNPAGPIFILKNFGWKDKIDITASTPGALTEEERAAAQKRLAEFSEINLVPDGSVYSKTQGRISGDTEGSQA